MLVSLPGKLLAKRDKPAQDVGIVVVVDPLHDSSDALKAHARIDVLGGKRRQGAVFLTIVLRENAVPELKITVTVAAGLAIGGTATDGRALVEVDFGAWAARSGRTSTPEVVLLP